MLYVLVVFNGYCGGKEDNTSRSSKRHENPIDVEIIHIFFKENSSAKILQYKRSKKLTYEKMSHKSIRPFFNKTYSFNAM